MTSVPHHVLAGSATRSPLVEDVAEAYEVPEYYSGLVTRTIAFVIDAAIVNAVAVITAAAVALGLSVLPGNQRLHGLAVALAGLAFVVWCVAYWATFWTTTGQTPGDRVMRIRVSRPDGSRLNAVRAIARVGATLLAALPLFAGFVPILLNSRRRGLHDRLVDTVVAHASPPVTVAASSPEELQDVARRRRRPG